MCDRGIYTQLVLSLPCPRLYLGLSMLEGEFFSQCWIPVVLKLQKQRRKQPRTDRSRGSGLTPLPQELLSSNRTSSRCQTVRRAAQTWIIKLIPLWQGNGGFDASGGRGTSGYFSINVVLIWENITEMCHFSSNYFLWFKEAHCIGIYVEKLLLLFQKLWNDRTKDVQLWCTAKFFQSVCAHVRSILLDEQHWAAASASWLSICSSTSASRGSNQTMRGRKMS